MIENIHLLGEDDFLPAIENEIKSWLDSHVTRGSLTSFDGTKLNYYITSPENPKGAIVIVHGMAEFWAKYHEYAWYLYNAGFKVFFLEQRGFGYSEGKMPDPQLIYIDDYKTYVEDLHTFIETVVKKESEGLPHIVLAHSMGGAVTTYYLERHPGFFKAALLSSPMMKMKAGSDLSPIVVFLLRLYSIVCFKAKSIAPNQKRFDPNTPIETSSAKSVPRFEYQLNVRRNDVHYQACAATLGWALASIKVHGDIMKNAKNITIPVTMMTAGKDHLINPDGYKEITSLLPHIKTYHYAESRHEIFNSDEATRKKYFTDVLTELESFRDM